MGELRRRIWLTCPPYPGTPRWVKVFGIIALVVLVLFVILLFTVRNASPVLHASLALLQFLVATVLALYKPRGMTRYGWRKRHQ